MHSWEYWYYTVKIPFGSYYCMGIILRLKLNYHRSTLYKICEFLNIYHFIHVIQYWIWYPQPYSFFFFVLCWDTHTILMSYILFFIVVSLLPVYVSICTFLFLWEMLLQCPFHVTNKILLKVRHKIAVLNSAASLIWICFIYICGMCWWKCPVTFLTSSYFLGE